MRGAKGDMRKKIFHNWGLKLGSLVLAFVLWLLVMQIDNPKEARQFRGIPVTLVNTELLDQQDKVYEVLDSTDRVNVTVRAPKSIIDQLTSSDIVAEADMSKLTEINTIAISFYALNADVEIQSANPDVLRLRVEDRARKPINVRYNTIGEAAEGYMVTSARPELTRIEVTGPASDVAQISYAGVEIDVSGATTDISASEEIVLYDAEGNELDLPSVTKSAEYVRMEVVVYATKEVPIEVNTMGSPERGYLATGVVESSPATVQIAGRAAALANVSEISIPAEELDITGATESVIKVIDVEDYLPDNIILADSNFDGNVKVTVYIEPVIERTVDISAAAITAVNVPQGYEVLFPEREEPYPLRISGLEEAVSALEADMIQGTVDLGAWMAAEDLAEPPTGTHLIPVTFALPAGVQIQSPLRLMITISELEDV